MPTPPLLADHNSALDFKRADFLELALIASTTLAVDGEAKHCYEWPADIQHWQKAIA